MDNSKIWLSPPHMSGNEMKYIQEAFDGNWISPQGPNIDGFEKDLEAYLGGNFHVAAVSSGTAALHLALTMLGVEKEDYVICQSLTFTASANPIIYMGAIPVFVDSENDTWNLCPNALEEAIKGCINKGKKPKAIIAVCLYGMPFKVEEIKKIANQYGIPIIEDSAEALGSRYKEKRCGTFGDIAVFSFNGNKIITTSGGGAIVLKEQLYKEKAVFLSTQAKDDAPHYQHSILGYNYRISNISAGIGRGQMEVLEERVNKRRENHQFYERLFMQVEGLELFTEPNEDFYSNHWLNVALVDDKRTKNNLNRDSLISYLTENKIESRPLWKPMHLQPLFEKAPYYGADVAENLFYKGICLPSGSNLTELQKERISIKIKNILQ